jgi:Na+-driven multidrug efflux pump
MLIFGHLGAPALGIAGSGCATAIVQWLMFLSLTFYIRAVPSLARYRLRPFSHRWDEIGHILRLGLPIGGILGLEIGVFATTGILMGLLGADALGAHQLVMNCISVIFMVPLGIAQAATVRVAVALGSGVPAAVRRAGFVAIMLGVAYMAIMAVVLVAAPRTIARIYVDIDAPANRGLVEIALYLLMIAAFFQIFDGMQAIRCRCAARLSGYDRAADARDHRLLGHRLCRRLAARLSRRLRSDWSLVGLGGGLGSRGADADRPAAFLRRHCRRSASGARGRAGGRLRNASD